MSDEKQKNSLIAMGQRGVSLTSMEDAWRFCRALEESGLAPKGMKTPAIFAVVQAGAELGLTPFRALSNMKAINGRVGPMGALAKALIRQANVLEPGTGFKEKYTGTAGEDDWTAHFSTLRRGEADVYTTSFSVKDAKRAGLWGKPGPWSQYPKRMLMWRAIGFHMDDYYSDILMGFHVAEVLEDYPMEHRIPIVMEPKEVPDEDPLLAEVERIGATMQPPEETPEEIIEVDGELVDPDTGEFLEERPRQARPAGSPLGDVLKEAEALEDEDLRPADPGNAAEEGEENDELF